MTNDGFSASLLYSMAEGGLVPSAELQFGREKPTDVERAIDLISFKVRRSGPRQEKHHHHGRSMAKEYLQCALTLKLPQC